MTVDQTSSPTVRTLLLRNLRMILKRRLLFAIVFLAVAAGGITYVALKPPVYVTSATVMFERAGNGEVSPMFSLNPVMETVPPHEFFKSILNSTLYRNKLAQTLVDSGYVTPEDITVQEAAYRNLNFTIDKNNVFADITARERDGRSAFLMVNSALATFIQRSKELESAELDATLSFLDQQLEVITRETETIERSIQQFQEQHSIDPADADRGVWGELYDLQRQLAETEVEYSLERLNSKAYGERFNSLAMQSLSELTEEKVEQIESLKSPTKNLQADLDEQLEKESNSSLIMQLQKQLQSMRSQLIDLLLDDGPSEPRLKQERAIMLQTLITKRTDSDLTLMSLSNQAEYLRQSISRFKADHPDLLESSLTFTSLQRQKEVLQNTYNLLTEKREDARIQSASETGGLKVIDPPYVPTNPENSNDKMYYAISFLLALLLAFGTCFVADLIDDSFKDPEEIGQLLGITTLGMIPYIRSNRNGSGGKSRRRKNPFEAIHANCCLMNSSDDPVVEAYRALKTNITFSFPDNDLKSLTISSPQAGEGKSLTSANLAISFAMSGMKTLLVDCDLRRPIQHTLFELPRSPGLSEILFNDVNSNGYHHKTRVPNLHLVTVGSSTPNPADLLSSEKMSKFIAKSEAEHDIVILDTPPVTFAVDARLLANRSDGLILVIQNERTRVELARRSLDYIEQVGGKVAGAVVNMISHRSYYNAYYYDYSKK